MFFKKIARDTESIIAICFIVMSLFFFIGLRDPILMKSLTDKSGPIFFPKLLAFLLLIGSVYILAERFKKLFQKNTEDLYKSQTPSKLLLLFCLTIICPLLMNYGGFIMMGLLSIFIFCKIISLSTKEAISLSIGLTFAVYLLFNTLLKVQLPKGMLF